MLCVSMLDEACGTPILLIHPAAVMNYRAMPSRKLPYSCVGPGTVASILSLSRLQGLWQCRGCRTQIGSWMHFRSQQWPDMCGILLVPVWAGCTFLAMQRVETVGRVLGR